MRAEEGPDMAEAEAKGLELDGPDGIGRRMAEAKGIGRRMAEAKGTGWLVEGTGPDGRDGRDGWQRRKGPDG